MILITGTAGFIGFHLARKILDEGIEVIGYDNVNDYYDPFLKEARLKILSDFSPFTDLGADLIWRYSFLPKRFLKVNLLKSTTMEI